MAALAVQRAVEAIQGVGQRYEAGRHVGQGIGLLTGPGVQGLAGRLGIVGQAGAPLGPRDRLVLVQVGEEQILLGLTPGRITPLHVLKEPVHLPDGEPATPEFAQRLLELLNKDPKGKP